MRAFVMIVVALGLAACTPAVPDSGRGVGFKNYSTYLKEKTQAAEAAAAAEAQSRAQTAAKSSARARADADAAARARAKEEIKASAKAEAEARAAARAAGRSAAQAEAEGRAAARASAKAAAKAEARYAAEAEAEARAAAKAEARYAAESDARYAAEAEAEARAAASAEPLSGFSPDTAAAAIDRADGLAPEPLAELPQADTRDRGNAPEGIREESGEMEYATDGVSDEQDFGAVSARETIESDKARIAKNRATYTVDQPGALPQRSGGGGPSIVEFALATSHPPGTAMYRRSSLRITSADRACSRYASPDLAQEAFLASGGPDRDRKGLDPDGDGYACSWDPRPFRTALQ